MTGLALAALAGLQAGSAMPPATAPPPTPPSEIVVTGERADRRLRDTASSVAVFRADDIAAVPSADRLDDVLLLVPNVQFGDGSQAPAIRGQDSTGVLRDLPAFLGGNRPRLALQIDGRPVDYNELVFGLASLWDVAQVEVFRSPQSTTQGVNSIAGAIFLTTVDPQTEWGARARVAIGQRQRRQASAMLTGPIAGEALAFRIAGDWGRQRPLSRIADMMRGADPDIDKQSLIRMKLLARPDFLAGARLELGYTHALSQAPQVERVRAPFEQRRDPAPGYGIFKVNVDALVGQADLDLARGLSSVTTLTASWSDSQRFAAPGLGEAQNDRRQISGESLLRWRPADRLRVQAGVHDLGSDLRQAIDLTALARAWPGNTVRGDRERTARGRPTPRAVPRTEARPQHKVERGSRPAPADAVRLRPERSRYARAQPQQRRLLRLHPHPHRIRNRARILGRRMSPVRGRCGAWRRGSELSSARGASVSDYLEEFERCAPR